ncbi:MAG TPA: class II aldolase/adducin family protein [Burkholderiales bacterium]|jgi:ribulose-5-phosphate 4-epimerase/fuculose-1-phosphate aldolase|nr:class II aldolase/adducin family protein [Burkholderiales bacterium]
MTVESTSSNVSRLNTTANAASDSVRGRVTQAEWDARVDLAAAYRLAAMQGWSDMLGTHISCRVPDTEDQFLINPYGLLFEEITASSLIKCDTEGNKLSESPYEINFAGFTIHSAIHMGRHDAHAVMHLHTGYGVAVSAQEDGLLPITQKALTTPFNQIRYHDYEGVAHDLTERERLLKDLGDGTMLILRNHGTLTVGASCGEMFARMYRLETACKFQILAMSGDAKLRRLPQEVIDHTAQQGVELSAQGGRHAGGKLLWAALLRKLDREQPDYAA